MRQHGLSMGKRKQRVHKNNGAITPPVALYGKETSLNIEVLTQEYFLREQKKTRQFTGLLAAIALAVNFLTKKQPGVLSTGKEDRYTYLMAYCCQYFYLGKRHG
ncbi:hypothetical protein ILYODFUR_003705 [Ilyodon furcidens]|uniref:Uncharacterized protein n=1 Tax=Ilyodon furcidens TaxID=33524 RepID=A0ABV0TGX8_9TELE